MKRPLSAKTLSTPGTLEPSCPRTMVPGIWDPVSNKIGVRDLLALLDAGEYRISGPGAVCRIEVPPHFQGTVGGLVAKRTISPDRWFY